MMVSLLFVASVLGQARDAKPTELIRAIVSSDRLERHQAAEKLTKGGPIPESALPNIVQYLKLEIAEAMVPDTRPARGKLKDLERIPVVGDEASLARIKANPSQYLERPFVLAGAAMISDFYAFGFGDAADTHYAIRFDVAAKNGQTDDSVTVYMPRFDGAALAERIAKTQEQQPNVALAVRLKCIIHRERLEGDLSHAADSIEPTDWQVLSDDKRTWMPWTFEGLGLGYTLMGKVGKASMTTCVDLIVADAEFQSPKADTMLKGTAIHYLLGLPAKDRTLAFRRVSLRAKKVKGTVAKEWTRRLYASLEAGRLML